MGFPTDLAGQWDLVSDLFDPTGRPGAPARIPRRQMVDAILYQARTGCQPQLVTRTWTIVPFWSIEAAKRISDGDWP